ncbi:MAG: threonine aldolase family protein [Ruminococcus sp.]
MERKLWFKSDYQQGAHPEILKRLTETARIPQSGYGTDDFSLSAEEKIRKVCKCEGAQVKFITGGTQANQLVISTVLESYEGVISADSGHINVHEAGAIEYSGHKVLTVPSHDGKVDAEDIKALIDKFQQDESFEHTVYPGMVYVSHPTELGTLYTYSELKAVSDVCREYSIPLYLDGARLGYGLMSESADLDMPAIAELVDVFYIGGTKMGALCGEAVVFTKNNMPKNFVPRIKQRGALLAKGFLNGVQFDALFTNDLYFRIGKHAIDMAMKLKRGFLSKGYELFADSPTNQQFVILQNEVCEKLKEKVQFECWEKLDRNRTAVRFVTGWATTEEEVDELLDLV